MKNAVLLLLCHTLLIWGCSSESSSIPKTENDILNKLIQSASASIVRVDELPVDTLYAKNKDILGRTSVQSFSPPARFGRVGGLLKIRDSIYVADRQQNCIWVVDNRGMIVRKIGQSGKGPGEYGYLIGLKKNKNNIFTFDISNSRIQMFDLDFNLQTTFNKLIGPGLRGGKSISVTDSLLYLSAMNTPENLISVYRATPPFQSLTSFHPRLITTGMQPGGYNMYSMDTNRKGDIVVSYTGLPYIFLYNSNHQLQHTIYIKFPEEDFPDNPPVEAVDKPAQTASEAIGVEGLIGGLSLTADRSLYFSRGNRLYYLYNNDENKYQAEWIKFFTSADANIRGDRSNGITISNFFIDEEANNIYFGSIFEEYIYRFSL